MRTKLLALLILISMILISCNHSVRLSTPIVSEDPKAGSPPPKPVCPKGRIEDWCRPMAKGEFGATTLGHTPDE